MKNRFLLFYGIEFAVFLFSQRIVSLTVRARSLG